MFSFQVHGLLLYLFTRDYIHLFAYPFGQSIFPSICLLVLLVLVELTGLCSINTANSKRKVAGLIGESRVQLSSKVISVGVPLELMVIQTAFCDAPVNGVAAKLMCTETFQETTKDADGKETTKTNYRLLGTFPLHFSGDDDKTR